MTQASASASTVVPRAAASRFIKSMPGDEGARGVRRPFATASLMMTNIPASCAAFSAGPADWSSRLKVACTEAKSGAPAREMAAACSMVGTCAGVVASGSGSGRQVPACGRHKANRAAFLAERCEGVEDGVRFEDLRLLRGRMNLVHIEPGQEAARLLILRAELLGCVLLHLVRLALSHLNAPGRGVLVAPFRADDHVGHLRMLRQPRRDKVFAQAVRSGAVEVANSSGVSRVEDLVGVRSHAVNAPLRVRQVVGVTQVDVAGSAERRHPNAEPRRIAQLLWEVGASHGQCAEQRRQHARIPDDRLRSTCVRHAGHVR
eukprot:3348431-Prymnesium_polylepis.2